MKTTITKTILLTIFALLTITASAYSQNFNAIRNMGATVNNPASSEISPVISPNGLSLYFTSDRTGGGQGGNDIWVSQRATLSSAWGAPQNLGATINSSSADNGVSFSLDGRTMFFQSNRAGMGGNDIYISTRTDANNDFGWTAPVIVPVVNSTSNEIQATYFEDPVTGAGTLIFSSDRVGTPGISFHFYQSTRNADGTFNPPTLINELNSVGAEFGAAIRRDGLEIFFCSSRPGGLGPAPPEPPTFDIWKSTRDSVSAPWNPPVLVLGISTTADERLPKLSPDGAILYYQIRPGAAGSFDLYTATRCSLYAADKSCIADRTESDFDGDGRTDISIFRPSDGTWWTMQSGNNTVSVRQFGANGDRIVPDDYDGDGRTDLAVFRPSDTSWWILNSSDSLFSVTQFGLATDKLVPADYDGDGRADIAVYRDGIWWIRQSSNLQLVTQQFGLSSDIPIAGVNTQ